MPARASSRIVSLEYSGVEFSFLSAVEKTTHTIPITIVPMKE